MYLVIFLVYTWKSKKRRDNKRNKKRKKRREELIPHTWTRVICIKTTRQLCKHGILRFFQNFVYIQLSTSRNEEGELSFFIHIALIIQCCITKTMDSSIHAFSLPGSKSFPLSSFLSMSLFHPSTHSHTSS